MLGISEEEYLRNQREMFFDKKFMAATLEATTAGGASRGPAELGRWRWNGQR